MGDGCFLLVLIREFEYRRDRQFGILRCESRNHIHTSVLELPCRASADGVHDIQVVSSLIEHRARSLRGASSGEGVQRDDG